MKGGKWNKDYKKKDIWQRCFKAAISVVRLTREFSYSVESKEIKGQIIRSAMSVVANLTEASAGYSYRDFRNKLNISRKEACETDCWLRMLYALDIGHRDKIVNLGKEYQEIIKILSAIYLKGRKK